MHVEIGYAQTARTQAEVRRRIAQEAYEAGARRVSCSDCGGPMYRPAGDYRRFCADCGAERSMSGAEQMSSKAGPVYERAVLAQFRFWCSEVKRLGLDPDPDD